MKIDTKLSGTKVYFQLLPPRPKPIKHVQCKFNATLFFKHFDWPFKMYNQSECLKIKFSLSNVNRTSSCGQSYNGCTIVNFDSRGIPD